jgi:cell division septum initiation protein DivIVA
MAGNPALAPSDAGFEVVRRGYDQVQVDAHLRRLDAELSILVTDRDAALAQSVQLARELDEARVRAEKLRAQVRTLVSPSQSPLGTTERIRSMLRLAEDEVADMLAGAEAEANRRIQEADAQAAQTLAAAQADADAIREEGRTDAEKMRQELEEERTAFELDIQAARERLSAERTSTEADLAARIEAAEDARARAWAESEARRTLVEEDFTIAMDQRRAEALTALAAERDAARRDVEQLRESAARQAREVIARAEEQSRERIAEAERRVSELVAARARVAEQLGRTQSMLQDTLGSMAVPPAELLGPTSSDQDAAGSPAADGAGATRAHPALDDERPAPGAINAAPRPAADPADTHRDETDTQLADAAPAGDNPVHQPRRRTKAASSRS